VPEKNVQGDDLGVLEEDHQAEDQQDQNDNGLGFHTGSFRGRQE
jgi:hypothetical protein